MPLFALDIDELSFPDPERAGPEGLLAIGGDFSPRRLISAYASGIFPWMVHLGKPVWFSPDPRMVLEPRALHVPRSLAKVIRRGDFEIRFDTAFEQVIEACRRAARPGQDGSWISRPYVRGLLELHANQVAHSVEAWRDGVLVGGLYGLSLGRVFFGESMFAEVADASKVAFATLVHTLAGQGFALIDCQQETHHLARFGASPWPRRLFLQRLRAQVAEETDLTFWQRPPPPWDGRTTGPPFSDGAD